nr:protoporphyrinogen oxidase [Corynebacterium lactis]
MVVTPQTVVVIGAGISGLTSAYELRRKLGRGARIVVIEKAPTIGGKLKTVSSDRGPLEVGAEAYLAFRKDATEFFSRLGLGEQLVAPSALPSQLYVDGSLRSLPRNTIMGVPSGPEGLESILSPETLDRIAMESDPSISAGIHWVPGDDANVGQLVEARYGSEVVDRIVSPLLGGVYSSTAYDLGLRATIPQLAAAFDQMASAGEFVSLGGAVKKVLDERKRFQQARLGSESVHSKPHRPVVFQTFRDGFEVLYRTLAEESGAEIRLNTSAVALARTDTGFAVSLESSSESEGGVETIDADGVVLAAPAHVTGPLLADVAADASEIIGGVDAASSAVVAMCFDTSEGLPEINGVLCEAGADLSAKAFTISSRKWPHIAQRYPAVVRASFGRFDDDSHVHRTDEDLLARARQDLARATGFTAEPVATMVQRWWRGIPRFDVGHGQLMEFAQANIADVRGLAASGAWLSGPGIPECISNARAAADKVAGEIY